MRCLLLCQKRLSQQQIWHRTIIPRRSRSTQAEASSFDNKQEHDAPTTEPGTITTSPPPSSNVIPPPLTTKFSALRDAYSPPNHPIVLAHGLLGFDELHLAGSLLPGVQYWRGIVAAYGEHNIECFTTSVPRTGSIEERAWALDEAIKTKLDEREKLREESGGIESEQDRDVNVVAHSMGGLDARFLISRIRPKSYKVLSLTTIATPHHGSSVADMLLRDIGPSVLPHLYSLLSRLNIPSGAFSQLTRKYICEEFNPNTPNVEGVRYFSYGASATPAWWSVFRVSHGLLREVEGDNDGLVGVASSVWPEGSVCEEQDGEEKMDAEGLEGGMVGKGDGYKGTLIGVTHLDLINWTNRLKRLGARAGVVKQDFNAVAFYLHIADMLAKEGL